MFFCDWILAGQVLLIGILGIVWGLLGQDLVILCLGDRSWVGQVSLIVIPEIVGVGWARV